MHQFRKFIFGMKLYMFRRVSLSIVRSLVGLIIKKFVTMHGHMNVK